MGTVAATILLFSCTCMQWLRPASASSTDRKTQHYFFKKAQEQCYHGSDRSAHHKGGSRPSSASIVSREIKAESGEAKEKYKMMSKVLKTGLGPPPRKQCQAHPLIKNKRVLVLLVR